MRVELALKGGTVVEPVGERRANVYVDDGRIVQVTEEDRPADRSVDVSGLIVLPGMVDSHVHLMDPGQTAREDFPTGTRAAAAAGVTTIVEHTHAHPVRSASDLREKVAYLEGRSNVDFGLAAHTWPDDLGSLAGSWEAGVTFFKIFTCTTHGVPGLDEAGLSAALTELAAIGAPSLIHCEDEAITEEAEQRLRALGRTDGGLLVEWRSRAAEEVAVRMVVDLLARTGARGTIAHVSTPEVGKLISEGRANGADVAAEACPQYFALREDDVVRWGALRKFTPPARARSDEDVDAMWRLIREGVLTHFSTDHAPSTLDQKLAGDIWEAPFGLPGLDTTLPFLLDAAFGRRIALRDVVRLYAEAPARRYGLDHRKGHLAPGADADMILVDPTLRWTVRNRDIVSKAGWSPYEGRSFHGKAIATYLRGELITEDGTCLDERTGRFLAGGGALGSAIPRR